jgi:putative hemolysin
MRISTMTLAAATALTLAGCGQGDGETASAPVEGAGGETPVPAPGKMDTPTPGLWRVTTRMAGLPEGMATPSVETCIERGSFEEMQRGGAQLPEGVDCSEQSFRREGNAMVGRSVCALPNGTRTETDTRVTGDFARRYTMEVKTRTTPAPSPSAAEMTMTMTAERIGDC